MGYAGRNAETVNGIEDKELQKFMIGKWLKEKKDVGGCAHHLPLSPSRIYGMICYMLVKIIAPTNEDIFC